MKKDKNVDEKPIVAICYDFDKTLSPKDMQEYTLFSKLGIGAQEFWDESNKFAKENGMDKILSYMKLIVKIAKDKEETLSLVKKDFLKMGKDVKLFEGLDTWFDRINKYAESLGLQVEHYIISAGLKEIIEGTSIAKSFTAIYASCFVYNASGVPIWPKQVVNYTQKTQYLFRINKNCLDLSDEESINKSVPKELRRVPFKNIVYIGDSETDIPAMKVVKKEHGYAIGVYNPQTGNPEKACDLLYEERINFFAPANYSEGSQIEQYVKKIIDKIKASEELQSVDVQQQALTNYLDRIKGVASYFKETILEVDENNEDLNETKKEIDNYFKTAKKIVENNYTGSMFECCDILSILENQKIELENGIKARKKQIKDKAREIK